MSNLIQFFFHSLRKLGIDLGEWHYMTFEHKYCHVYVTHTHIHIEGDFFCKRSPHFYLNVYIYILHGFVFFSYEV